MKIGAAILTIAGLASIALPSAAHHSAAMFDQTKMVTISGKIRQFQYTNPHAWLYVTSVDADGKTTDWAVELGAPTMIQHMGIMKSTFAVGESVTVRVNPMKDGRPAGEFISAQKADGSTVGGMRGPPPPPPAAP